MRNIAITLNSIVAIFFAGCLAYTFVAREHLNGLARDFVTEKTLQYSAPVVEVAAEALDPPVVKKFLSDEQSAAVRREITAYRGDPAEYVADLTRQKMLLPKPANANPLWQKIASWKERVRSFYDKTLLALIVDLRIFSASNLCAALLGLGLAYRSREQLQISIVWFSILMFITVLYCSWMYVDDLTFFRILFRTHMGWWYPLFLGVVLAALYLEYGHAMQTEASLPVRTTSAQ